MAMWTITHTCGHTERVNLVGKEAARASRAAWLESKPCRDCERTARAAAAAEANAAAAEANAAAEMPALTGSPKQIAWAETIRAKVAAEIDAIVAAYPRPANEMEQAAIDAVLGQTSAAAWIDSRLIDTKTLLMTAGRKIMEARA